MGTGRADIVLGTKAGRETSESRRGRMAPDESLGRQASRQRGAGVAVTEAENAGPP